MNTPNASALKPGDIRQAGDLIQLSNVPGDYTTGQTHTVIWKTPKLVAPHTIGRVILPADLMTARFFRP